MSKAHKAILGSLRQKPPRQPRGVQTKGIQSFEVMRTFAETTTSRPRRVEPAQPPSSATQSKLQLNRCWRALRSFIPCNALLPVWGSLCAKEKKVLENCSGLLSVTLKQPGLCQQDWEGCAATASPAASHGGLSCGQTFGSGPQARIPA